MVAGCLAGLGFITSWNHYNWEQTQTELLICRALLEAK